LFHPASLAIRLVLPVRLVALFFEPPTHLSPEEALGIYNIKICARLGAPRSSRRPSKSEQKGENLSRQAMLAWAFLTQRHLRGDHSFFFHLQI
jgi:hypothetical protein